MISSSGLYRVCEVWALCFGLFANCNVLFSGLFFSQVLNKVSSGFPIVHSCLQLSRCILVSCTYVICIVPPPPFVLCFLCRVNLSSGVQTVEPVHLHFWPFTASSLQLFGVKALAKSKFEKRYDIFRTLTTVVLELLVCGSHYLFVSPQQSPYHVFCYQHKILMPSPAYLSTHGQRCIFREQAQGCFSSFCWEPVGTEIDYLWEDFKTKFRPFWVKLILLMLLKEQLLLFVNIPL